VEEVERIAAAMSAIRESVPLDWDGVYCPICHIANVDRGILRTPAPNAAVRCCNLVGTALAF
jgi:hypothetical protein